MKQQKITKSKKITLRIIVIVAIITISIATIITEQIYVALSDRRRLSSKGPSYTSDPLALLVNFPANFSFCM